MITWKDLPKKNPADILILVLENTANQDATIKNSLPDEYQIKLVENQEQALQVCEATLPDLILIDIDTDETSGLEACRALRKNPYTCDIPVIILRSIQSEIDENICWQAGASDFIAKPASPLTIENRFQVHLKTKLQADAQKQTMYVDGLTGIYSRHMLNELLARNIGLGNRNKTPTAALMVDLDWFKAYNDAYGHENADDVLKQIARAIKSNLKRPVDILVRYAGEEFLGLLPDTHLAGACHVAEEIVKTIEALKIPHQNSPTGYLTVSVGVTVAEPNTDMDGYKLVQAANAQLKQAKEAGKNQAVG